MRNEIGVGKAFIIGHVGSFNRWKNHNFLISVFKKINDIRPDAILLLVGKGKLQNQVACQIEKNELTGKVFMLGSRSDVYRLLQAMDVFVFPSHFEGFGNAVTEAQAAGLPSVVSDTVPHEVGVTELVEFVPLDKGAEAWANIIIEKFNNTERRNTAEEIIKAGYDIKPIAKWYEKFYLENA